MILAQLATHRRRSYDQRAEGSLRCRSHQGTLPHLPRYLLLLLTLKTHNQQELIKVRGFQVAPAELEGHLLEHADVVDACVVGIPDQYSGELPYAYVVPSPDAQARIARGPAEEGQVRTAILQVCHRPCAIVIAMGLPRCMGMQHVADHKVYYKRLAGIEFLPAIPKNPSGKLLRRVLREQAKTDLAAGKLKLTPKPKL